MVERLDVYLRGAQVATLELVRGSRYRLEYLPGHVDDPSAVPVSVQFPVVPGRYSGDDVKWFLENLLPDREDDTKWLPDGREDHRFSLGGPQGKFALALHGGG